MNFDLNSAVAAIEKSVGGIERVAIEDSFEKHKDEVLRMIRNVIKENASWLRVEGKDGKDAKEPTPKVGQVVSADHPEVRIRKQVDEWVFDFAFPRGEKGETPSKGVLAQFIDVAVQKIIAEDPERFRGATGAVGPSPSQADLRFLIERVIAENPDRFRGQRGERGAQGEGLPGPEGRRGAPGLQGEPGVTVTREEVGQWVIQALSQAGVHTELIEKLVRVKAEIKRLIHEADSRHIAHLSDAYRTVDRIIGGVS
jgi:hypothetical protein